MNDWNTLPMGQGPQDATETHHTHPARDAERSQRILDHERSQQAGKAEAPIGVFDSGAGGLTVLSALRQELPGETYLYFGDTVHCPYGMRSDAEITELSICANRFLIEQGAKLIVVACNIASQTALSTLRATFSVPFVGVVPAVKPAALVTRKGRIGIAVTNKATRTPYLRQLINKFAEGISVYPVDCPELVTLVEQGELDGPLAEKVVQEALQPLLVEDVDVIVLGCTHFPALLPIIERITSNRVQIIDSGSAVARRTRSVLEAEGLISPAGSGCSLSETLSEGQVTRLQVWCSGDSAAFSKVASRILGYPIVARQSLS